MKLIAIDTSTEACSAAILDGETVLERFEIARQSHTELILPMIDSLLKESGYAIQQFDAIAFGRGPGSFTGIRIGTGVVQGLALGAGLAVAPVSSLAAIAQGVFRCEGRKNVLAAIDARMKEIYWGCYQLNDQGMMESVQDECVAKADSLSVPVGSSKWFGAGTAWSAYEQELLALFGETVSGHDGCCLPHARDIAVLAAEQVKRNELVSVENVEPVYLRNEVAWKKIRSQLPG
ncbi:MAG TPA: tRNA (adenosine(37)-N6)-threonylcarbamoyltransferase complex dimerization subunit type 1 TsaB [Gammaproteobacteria bacterium]|nr:tRNA (adenosine(37)-N6)-threonylcarbamoyltransferase complex dimerization subunit type 1 TsaB [Gammaproteobacteria bacterium]